MKISKFQHKKTKNTEGVSNPKKPKAASPQRKAAFAFKNTEGAISDIVQ